MHEVMFSRAIKWVLAGALLALLGFSSLMASEEKDKWQVGVILQVKPHDSESEQKQYEVSVRVEKKVYVVLYAPEANQVEPDFYVGMNRPVLIRDKVLKYNDMVGRPHSVEILRVEDAPPPKE